jgi:hypothetical protein
MEGDFLSRTSLFFSLRELTGFALGFKSAGLAGTEQFQQFAEGPGKGWACIGQAALGD